MGHDAQILIAGGGLNGTVLALAFAQAGQSVALIDAQSVETRADAEFDGRGYALAHASVRVLRALGLWDGLQDHAQPIWQVKASDGRAGEGAAPFFLHLDSAELEEGALGHMIEDRYLRRAALATVAATDKIAHLAPERIIGQKVSPGGVSVQLESGRILSGHLLVGCDGRDSGTARRAGIKRTHRDYAQTALVCAVAHEHPHQGIAHQFFMPPGPLAILPLPDNRSSIVWTERNGTAAVFSGLDDAAYLDALRPRFGDFLGEISLVGKRYSYPLSLSLAYDYVADRVALLGDAAHGIHPIAGQGLNLGLRDVAALAEVVADAARRGEDIGAGDVLARYQRWRRFDSTAMALATDGFNRLFSNDNPVLRGLRDIGMELVSRSPAMRRGVMRRAAGLSGDLPRLARGLAV